MLLGRAIGCAAVGLMLLWTWPAVADMTIGGACTTGAGSPQAANGNNVWCNGSTWQFPAYQFGASTATCNVSNPANAGIIQWTGSAFQACNGTSWGPIGGSAALSSLTSATATNSFDNATYAQTWTWNTLTTQTALTLSSTSETTGSLLALTDSNAASSTGKVLSASTATTGAGAAVAGSITGSNNTGYGVYANNASTSGWSLYAAGGAPSYFAGAAYSGSTGGDYGNSNWQILARKDQNAGTYLGLINGTSGASAATDFEMIGGTGNSNFNLVLNDNSGSPYVNFATGSGVASIGFLANSFKFQNQPGSSTWVTINSSGSIGIGTTSPLSTLDIAGAIYARSYNAGSSSSISWSQGNEQYTTASCGAFTFTNMQDGGSYTLAVEGTTSGTCSFSQSGLTFKLPSNHGATTASTMTLYHFVRLGTYVFVTWMPGY